MLSPKQKIVRTVLFMLMAVGVAGLLLQRPFLVLGVLAVIGAVFYLYKRPPRWLIRLSYPGSRDAVQVRGPRNVSRMSRKKKQKNKYNKKQRAFRVIDGNKKDTQRNQPRNTKTQ